MFTPTCRSTRIVRPNDTITRATDRRHERSRAEDLSENLAATETELAASAATVGELETEPAAEPTLVVAGSGALSERQQDMVDMGAVPGSKHGTAPMATHWQASTRRMPFTTTWRVMRC